MKIAETVTFGGVGLDRTAELRADPAAIADLAADARARCVLLWQGKPLVSDDDGLRLTRLAMDHPVLADAGPAVLLGREGGGGREGGALFARDLRGWQPDVAAPTLGAFHDPSEQTHPSLDPARFVELRRIMTRLDPAEAERAATAKAILGWHATHGFCARCGAASDIALAGWQRLCPECRAHHFPRTDPVVIMLVTHGNATLLGRSHGWPEGFYSCLAGFVEPGETMEAAVRREVMEETGVAVGRVRYLASQPWAFPSSLMLGCHAEALDTAITVDPEELDDAIWLSREAVGDVMAGLRTDILPARDGAIAHFLLRHWLADRLD